MKKSFNYSKYFKISLVALIISIFLLSSSGFFFLGSPQFVRDFMLWFSAILYVFFMITSITLLILIIINYRKKISNHKKKDK